MLYVIVLLRLPLASAVERTNQTAVLLSRLKATSHMNTAHTTCTASKARFGKGLILRHENLLNDRLGISSFEASFGRHKSRIMRSSPSQKEMRCSVESCQIAQ